MASLSPPIKFHVLDANGNPAAGWKVWTYEAGTSTPKATYTTSAASVANANPVILDARGEATIWLSGTYKIRVTTAADVLVYEDDNVSDGTTNGTFTNSTFAGSLTISSANVTWSGNPTHSGNHTFSGNVAVNGNTTLGNAAGDALTVAPNAVTWSNNPTHSGNHSFSGDVTGSSTALSVPQGVILGNTARSGSTILDWYEEGTWTPSLKFGGASVGMTTSVSGRYVRIGRLVYASMRLTVTAKGSSTGAATITGLPFNANEQTLMTAQFEEMTGLSAPPVAMMFSASSQIDIYTTAVATGNRTAMTDASFTNSSVITMRAYYEVS